MVLLRSVLFLGWLPDFRCDSRIFECIILIDCHNKMLLLAICNWTLLVDVHLFSRYIFVLQDRFFQNNFFSTLTGGPWASMNSSTRYHGVRRVTWVFVLSAIAVFILFSLHEDAVMEDLSTPKSSGRPYDRRPFAQVSRNFTPFHCHYDYLSTFSRDFPISWSKGTIKTHDYAAKFLLINVVFSLFNTLFTIFSPSFISTWKALRRLCRFTSGFSHS